MGRGGGQVVGVLYSYDPSSNPADAYSFSVKFVFEKKENKQNRDQIGSFKIIFTEGEKSLSAAEPPHPTILGPSGLRGSGSKPS